MRPLIGIPLSFDDRGHWKVARDYHYIDAAYARAIEAAGATPVYLPMQSDPSPLIGELDGLLIPGGDDLAPPRAYPAGVEFDLVPPAQLSFDRGLLAAALERDLPVLAICYGMQLLAITHGGTLCYDIATDLPDADPHRLPEADGRHALRVEADSRLADAIGVDPPPVNSLHHQAVDTPGAELRVVARADDGLVEAIERERSGFCLGVQWHPEKLSGVHRDALFRAFVASCQACARQQKRE